MKKRRISNKLNVFREMPELYHKLPDQEYDPEKSEVLQWIAKQPELMLWLMKNIGAYHNLIEYDKKTSKWHGVKEGDQNNA